MYHQLAEGNLIYDRKLKAYFPSDTLTPSCVGLELLRPRQHKLDFQVLRLVHEAIREKRQLKVVYQSMNRESRTLTLEPHTLLYLHKARIPSSRKAKRSAVCGLNIYFGLFLLSPRKIKRWRNSRTSIAPNRMALMAKLITRLVMLIQM